MLKFIRNTTLLKYTSYTYPRPTATYIRAIRPHYSYFHSSGSLRTGTQSLPEDALSPAYNADASSQLSTTTDYVAAVESTNFILATNQSVLELVHNQGLPWWATIVVTTIGLRVLFTLPIALYQQRAIARRISLAPIVQSWAETLKRQVALETLKAGYDKYNQELQAQYRAKVKEIYRDNDCGPLKSFLLPWVQIPLFISMSLTIRGMAAFPLPWLKNSPSAVEGFSTGGFSGYFDLTAMDSTMLFPVLIGATNLFNVEMNWLFIKHTPTTRQRYIHNFFRILSVCMIPIASQVPMALCIYWLASSSYSVVQNVAFRIPTFRKKLGLSA